MTKKINLAARHPGSHTSNEFYSQIYNFLNKGAMSELDSFLKRENLYLPVKSWQFDNKIIKIGDNFWTNRGGYSNQFGEINYYSPIDLPASHKESYLNLLSVVEEPISSGDKIIIREVARQCFIFALERAFERNGLRLNIQACTNLRSNEMALSRLESFGFKLKSSKRFVTYDLRNRRL